MKQTIRKTISVLLALVMVLTLLPAVTVTAHAGGPTSGTEGSLAGNVAINNTTTPTDLETPLTLEAKTGGTILVTDPKGMQYSRNGGDKQPVTGEITVSTGDTVAFYGTADCYDGTTISDGTAQCYIYGNIMSLINATNFATATALTKEGAFYGFFVGNECLLSHQSRKLVLPATTLTNSCYAYMFLGCTNLITAPELPATTLAEGCYRNMFQNCTSLTTAPALPATALANSCYNGMFRGCAGLTTAPALPATTLAERCYYNMFRGCTGLTTAPELPATTLVFQCYCSMFYDCTKLNAVTCLATDISVENATANWLSGVAPTGTFTKASGTDWPTESPSGIPEGWMVNDYSDGTTTPVTYLDAQVDDTTHAVTYTPATCTDYTPVASATDAVTWGTAGETTWYVVQEDVTIDNTVTFYGDVRLILCDGATLTVTAASGDAIKNSGSGSLTVYAQSTGADMGILQATGQGCGIQGGKNSAVTINGGDLHVSGKYGICVRSAALTINGGKVTATADGSDKSAAVREVYGGITINGGTVIATGGQYGIRIAESLTVNGGEITASGSGCAIFTNTSAPVTLAPGLGVYAGADESSAVKVTKAFPGSHDQKWAHIYATPEPTPVYHSEETPSAALTVTSEIGTITRVTVDGKEVDSKYYFVSGNSVVLSDAFMRSLANGTHTIRLYDGVTYATATWTVSGNTIVAPKTADPGLAIYAALAVSATLGLGYMGKKRKED